MTNRALMICMLLSTAALARGQAWELYDSLNSELPANQVNTLFIDAYGGKWFGTPQGLAHFHGKSWSTYTEAEGLAGNEVVDLHGSVEQGKTRLLVSTTGGVSELSYDESGPLQLDTYRSGNSGLSSDSLSSSLSKAGVVYYASPRGLDIRSGDSWTFVEQISTIDGPVSLEELTCMALTPHGWNYLGSREQGVARLQYDVDGVSGASSFSTEWSGLLSDRINDIHITEDGAQWYATGKGVAHHLGYETKTHWETYTEYSSGLPSNLVHAVAVDATGRTWAGTEQGLTRLDGLRWSTFPYLGELGSLPVLDLDFAADGSIWFATPAGVVHLDESANPASTGPLPLPSELLLKQLPGMHGEEAVFQVQVPAPRQLSIYILDLNGRLLDCICQRAPVSGTRNFTWDIHGGSGPKAAGMYIVLLKTEKEILSKKIFISSPNSLLP